MLIKKSIQRTAFAWALAAAAVTGGAGCAATVTATPVRARVLYSYPVVAVDAAPVRIHESPRVMYHGHPAYLVGTRWYYPSDGGWVYFREEPRELRHYREQRVYQRTPARATRPYDRDHDRNVAPPRRVTPPKEEQRRRSYD